MSEEYEYKKTNREKRLTNRGRSSYCFGCDAARVNDGAKCHVCGYYHNPRRLKHGKNG